MVNVAKIYSKTFCLLQQCMILSEPCLFKFKFAIVPSSLFAYQIYYILAVVEDLIFRTLWTLNISVGEAGSRFLQGDILSTILAIMEIFRRFVWNFFRVENEHLNNAGQFRAVRDIAVVPLDLRQLPREEDKEEEGGGAEKPLREHFQLTKRRISNALIEVVVLEKLFSYLLY